MYESFFGLRERPFDLTPDPRYLVLTSAHREVLSNLEYAIASRKGITLVIGEPGSGKTTLIRAVLQRQPETVHCVHVSNPTLSRDEFVEMLASRFGLSTDAAHSKAVMLAELEALLASRRERGEVSVLIVDEAQSVPLELLEEIRLLVNIEADDQKLLSVILAGQPELAQRLEEQALRQLKQRVALRCELRSLTLQEAGKYLAGRIAAAGGNGAQVFTREAVALIHAAAAGLPRTMSVLADNALLGGFAAGQKPVTRTIVREVCRDFGVLPVQPSRAVVESSAVDVPAVPERPPVSVVAIKPPHSQGNSSVVAPSSGTEDGAATGDPPKRWLSSLTGRHTRLFGS